MAKKDEAVAIEELKAELEKLKEKKRKLEEKEKVQKKIKKASKIKPKEEKVTKKEQKTSVKKEKRKYKKAEQEVVAIPKKEKEGKAAKKKGKKIEEEVKEEKTFEEELEEKLTDEEIENFQIEKVNMEKLMHKVCEILAEREAEGMIQSDLWKKLKLTSRDGSRLALKLERMGIITREKILEKGRWTYKLIIKKTPVSTESIENAPCLTCPVEQRCTLDGEVSPRTCQWIEDWVLIEIKKQKEK